MVAFLLPGASAAWAADGCPAFPDSLPSTTAGARDALDAHARHAQACAGEPRWHARRGALLLRLGQAAEAAESLERALLLAPDYHAARLDYADALATLGDYDSAHQLARDLLAAPGIPAAARDYLNARLRQWARQRSGWRYRQQAGASLGWESNLNGGPVADSIGLTLPEGVVNLPLDAASRPQRGFALSYDWSAVGLRPLDAGRHAVLQGQLRIRDAAGGHADYLNARFDAGLGQVFTGHGEGLVRLGVREQRFGQRRILSETRAAVHYQWLGAPCRPRVALDHAWRNFLAAPELDSRQPGLELGLACARGPWRVDAELRHALDQPRQADRPGGRQQQTELGLAAYWHRAPYRGVLEYTHAWADDSRGYSPLLQYDARRSIVRDAARIEWAREVRPGLEWVVSLDYFRQRSNLTLFELDNLGLYFGARFRQ